MEHTTPVFWRIEGAVQNAHHVGRVSSKEKKPRTKTEQKERTDRAWSRPSKLLGYVRRYLVDMHALQTRAVLTQPPDFP